jgi:hypothetical protein
MSKHKKVGQMTPKISKECQTIPKFISASTIGLGPNYMSVCQKPRK